MQKRAFFVGVFMIVAVVLACGCTQEESTGAEITPAPTTAVQAEAASVQSVPTPPGEWSGKKPEEVKFVDPSVYHITPTETTIAPIQPPNDLHVDTTTMKEYAKISSTEVAKVMATEAYHIPFPYWELDYTADAKTEEYGQFNVEIRDAEDPNRLVGEIDLKRADFMTPSNSNLENTANSGTILFREGFRDYYFVIKTDQISSFSLVIRAPAYYMV